MDLSEDTVDLEGESNFEMARDILLRSAEPIEGGIVWSDEAAATGGSVLCTEWADLKARVGQAIVPPRGPCFVIHLGPFVSEYDAKMFAEKCLKARFFEKVQTGEAQPMEGHLPAVEEGKE